jgi:hypothetical protein
MGERDQVASTLVKFRQSGTRPGGLDVAADVGKDPLHSRLAVDFAINVPIDSHD